jgi:alpha-acetolactate decarboxylase
MIPYCPPDASDNKKAEHVRDIRHARVVASHLAKTVLVANYFYRVRMEAVFALVNVRALL